MALCCIAFKGYAGGGTLPDAQGHDLKLSYSRTTLKTVADAITQQVGIVFSYEIALADYPMENLYVTEQGAALDAILKTVFTPRGIDYRVVDKVVVLTRSAHPAQTVKAAPAKAQVTGVVRDAAGNPMIGVTVTVKGTLVGVSTGVDGSYTIPADKDAMLLFSYIGYRNQEEPVGQRTQIDVTMQEDQLVMDEVVVVGYGTLKKRNIVGAVENLAGDAVENRPNADITRSLQGQIPGLNIVQTDGKAAHGGHHSRREQQLQGPRQRRTEGEQTRTGRQRAGAHRRRRGRHELGESRRHRLDLGAQGCFVGSRLRRPRRIRRNPYHDQESRKRQGARELQRFGVAAPPHGDLGGQRGDRPRAVGRGVPRIVSQLVADGHRPVAVQQLHALFERMVRRAETPPRRSDDGQLQHRRQRQLQLLRRNELAQGDLQVGELLDHARRQHSGRPRGRELLRFGTLLQSGRHLQGGRGDLQEVQPARQRLDPHPPVADARQQHQSDEQQIPSADDALRPADDLASDRHVRLSVRAAEEPRRHMDADRRQERIRGLRRGHFVAGGQPAGSGQHHDVQLRIRP